MNAFENFAAAVERLEAAESAFQRSKARIESFSERSAQELSDVLGKFSRAGLFPEIDTSLHEASRLTPYHHCVAAYRIEIRAKNIRASSLASDDIIGSRIAEEIAEAARVQKVPVVHQIEGGQSIQVSSHVKEREEAPEILLRALAAYADKKGKSELAASAREAAERMKTLVPSFREIE
jgi:hypothetical protein